MIKIVRLCVIRIIWRQATNQRKRLIEAMVRTFDVRSAFIFGSHDGE